MSKVNVELLGKLSQEKHNFEACLGYTVSSWSMVKLEENTLKYKNKIKSTKAREIVQWYSTCLVYIRPQGQSSI